MQGLLGYRVLLIKKEDEARFARMSLAELKEQACYQGQDWPDTAILAANGFTVRGVVDFKRIHTMLERGNVRCFPRGLLEAWSEIDSLQLKNVIVDRHFLLIYPTDAYFFVAKGNAALADLLEQGLRAAIKDGSFQQHLYHYPANQKAFALSLIQIFGCLVRSTPKNAANDFSSPFSRGRLRGGGFILLTAFDG